MNLINSFSKDCYYIFVTGHHRHFFVFVSIIKICFSPKKIIKIYPRFFQSEKLQEIYIYKASGPPCHSLFDEERKSMIVLWKSGTLRPVTIKLGKGWRSLSPIMYSWNTRNHKANMVAQVSHSVLHTYLYWTNHFPFSCSSGFVDIRLPFEESD